MPLYRARTPPSVLNIITRVAHMPGSLSLWAWLRAANDADWIERRVRTISKGYVQHTEVIPAAPPQIRRRRELISAPGEGSKNCCVSATIILFLHGPRCKSGELCPAYLLVNVVAAKLHGRVRHNSYAICAISSHESAPPFVLPHLHEALPNR